ncbi:MAG: hypothetical protein LBF85_03540, partial [Tannerella sp.]|nr:hypothetical protein [Tannerella sp.]
MRDVILLDCHVATLLAMTSDAIAGNNGIPVIARSVATWQSRFLRSFNLSLSPDKGYDFACSGLCKLYSARSINRTFTGLFFAILHPENACILRGMRV